MIWPTPIPVYSQPDLTGEKIGTLNSGSIVVAYEKHGEWIKHISGWVLIQDRDVLVPRSRKKYAHSKIEILNSAHFKILKESSCDLLFL